MGPTIGAIVALVVNVRRQHLQERRQTLDIDAAFAERFREAARQLGAASATERIAGVYAMASLTDHYPERAQQCVDVLCGYLGLPYDPSTDHLESRTTNRIVAEGVTIHESVATRPHDTQVRDTIVTVVRHRTQNAADPWTALNYHFSGGLDADAGETIDRYLMSSIPDDTLPGPASGFSPKDLGGRSHLRDRLRSRSKRPLLDQVEKARYAADTDQRELDAAVTHARATGASREAIGRAAGMTRQSAHQRWAGLDRVRP